MAVWRGLLPAALGLALALTAGLLLARLPLVEAVALLALCVAALATLVEPLAGLVCGLFMGLLRAYLQAEVPQIPAQIGHVFIALAVVVHVARGLIRRDLRVPFLSERGVAAPPGRAAALGLLAFIGAAWLSLWNAEGLVAYGLPEFVKWIEILLVLWVVAERAKPRHLPWLVGALLLVGTFQAGVGVYQFALRGAGPRHLLIPGSATHYRAYGTFEQPNPYAGYIGMTLALVVGVALGLIFDYVVKMTRRRGDAVTRRPLARRILASPRHRVSVSPRLLITASLCLPLLLVALGASWSRGAWFGFAAALAAMAVALPRRVRWGLLLVALLAGLTAGLYTTGLLPAAIVTRLTDFAADLRLADVRGVGINNANYAVVERLAHWQAALEMWRSHFWTGVGLGCYEAAYPRFALLNWPIALGHAHNIYLNLLAETGLLGLLAYAAFWTVVIGQTWRATRRAVGLARGVAIGLLGAWTQLAVHQLFDNLYVNNVHLLVGLLLGLLVLVSQDETK